MSQSVIAPAEDHLTYRIIGCAIAVHKQLGPGLVESPYDDCMERALSKAGLSFVRRPRIALLYDGSLLDREFRPDYVVEQAVVVELKSVAHFLPVHQAQLLTYLKLSGVERGLLINFNVALLVTGIKRLILSRAPEGAPEVV